MLSNSRILAKKTQGKNTVLLVQANSSYVLILGTYTNNIIQTFFSKKINSTFTVLAERYINREEALLALEYMNRGSRSRTTAQKDVLELSAPQINTKTPVRHQPTVSDLSILLLETSKVSNITKEKEELEKPIVSPYFPTLDIFLSSQMTCAPNTLKG
jgi:hypothetical protein